MNGNGFGDIEDRAGPEDAYRPGVFPSCYTCTEFLPLVNVKDFPYNARGNGLDDDTAAIQQAIDDVEAQLSGLPEEYCGVVFFPHGTYVISQASPPNGNYCLRLKSRIRYLGQPPQSVGPTELRTTLKFASGHQPGKEIRMCATRHTQPDSSTGVDLPWRNMVFEWLTFDGNSSGNPGLDTDQCHAIFLAGVKCCVVRNCTFVDIIADGINVHTGHLSPQPSEEIVVYDCEFSSFLRSGMHFKHSRNCDIHNNLFRDAPHGTALNIEVDSSTITTEDIRFQSNVVERCGAGVKIVGGSFNSRVGNGFYVFRNRFDLLDPGQLRSNAVAIRVLESRDVVIKDNVIRRARGHAILIRSCGGLIIEGNDIRETLPPRHRPRGWEAAHVSSGGWVIDGPDAVIVLFAKSQTRLLPVNDNVDIVGNLIVDNVGLGVRISRTDSFRIARNTINSNASSGVDLRDSTTRGDIRCNMIGNNGGTGISIIDGATYNVFRRNVIQLNGDVGIWLYSTAGWANDFGRFEDWGWNCIVGNGVLGLRVDMPAVTPGPFRPGRSVIEAAGNWWGCADGPLATGCDGIEVPDPNVVVGIDPSLPDCGDVFGDFVWGDCSLDAFAEGASASPISGRLASPRSAELGAGATARLYPLS